MQQHIGPISNLRSLAGDPGPLKFKVKVKLKSGDELEVADPRATRAMVALMDAEAVMGGAASHWGGPAAFAELMSACHGLMFFAAARDGAIWHERFNFVNDAGHCENGLYALKANYGWADVTLEELRTFRKHGSRLTGHGEAHMFPSGILVSNGPLGSGLPQAQGLALADMWAGRRRTTICAISDGACMEGEARESLAAIPGLASKGKLNPFVMIISDNNTKLSGRIDQDSFPMGPSFNALKDLGWRVIDLHQGQDIVGCALALEKAIKEAEDNPRIPVAVHAHTIKGFGVKKTVESSSGGHGFPLKDPVGLKEFLEEIYSGAEVPTEFIDWSFDLLKKHEQSQTQGTPSTGPKSEKVQAGVSRALIKMREQGYPVVSVSADLQGSTGLADFHKKFPEASLDVGVAEANMISTAVGLSLGGYIPVVDTFSQFGITKGNLPLIMSALSQGPVIAIFSHVGFQDAADGASHQALTYFAATCAIPHTDVHALVASDEAEALVSEAVEHFAHERKSGRVPRTQIFFLGRENFPSTYGPSDLQPKLGSAQIISEKKSSGGLSVTLVAAGALLGQALEAQEMLLAKGVGSIVVNPSQINRPDVKTLAECLKKTNGFLVTVEDHQVIGGMGAILVHALSQAGCSFQLRSLGVRDSFGCSAYQALDLYREHEMSASAIAAAALEMVGL